MTDKNEIDIGVLNEIREVAPALTGDDFWEVACERMRKVARRLFKDDYLRAVFGKVRSLAIELAWFEYERKHGESEEAPATDEDYQEIFNLETHYFERLMTELEWKREEIDTSPYEPDDSSSTPLETEKTRNALGEHTQLGSHCGGALSLFTDLKLELHERGAERSWPALMSHTDDLLSLFHGMDFCRAEKEVAEELLPQLRAFSATAALASHNGMACVELTRAWVKAHLLEILIERDCPVRDSRELMFARRIASEQEPLFEDKTTINSGPGYGVLN